MGARPSSFKKGGGFLHNVDGVITDYEFTDTFPGADARTKKKGSDEFTPLYTVLSVKVDGASDIQTTTIFTGNADDFEISADGKTLTPVEDNGGLRANSDFSKLIGSLVEAGFPETSLPEDEEPINYEAIIGTRVTFTQVRDEDAMAKAAKKWRQSGGKFNEAGQKKGKDGKYYNLQYLTVSVVLGLPDVDDTLATKRTAKASTTRPGANVKAAGGKPNGKAVDLDALAKDTLLEILGENDGKLMKSKLPGKIASKLGPKHPHREEIRKLIYADDFLATEDGWTYDQASKNQLIELAE